MTTDLSRVRPTPRMAQLLERIRRAQHVPLHHLSPQQARAAYERAAEILDLPRASVGTVQDWTLPLQGGRPSRRYLPEGAGPQSPAPTLLYLHGGGFVVGSLETHDSLCRQLVRRSGAAVVALDYRLAPEAPFPAAWDDAWAALQALAQLPEHGREWGLDTSRMAVAGDSAGGTLAAYLALRSRNEGPRLALQVLITPGAASADTAPSRRAFAAGYLLDADLIDWFFSHVLAPEDRSDWRFAPLHAEDVDGAPPACVVLAECDPMVDEGLEYADHLRRAGVPVTLELVPGVTHDFIKMGRALPEATRAMDAIAQELRAALGLGG